MAVRNGKTRKEVYLSADERREIRVLALRFHIDETSMIRILLQLGKEALPGNAYHVANNVPVPASEKIEIR